MVDDSERVTVLHERYPTARVAHKCYECHRAIQPGERYMVERFVYEGNASTHKTCRHCQIARNWLTAECDGFIYGCVGEDIDEHADEGHYGFGMTRLAAGIRSRWQRRDGRLWPLPKMPKSAHDNPGERR